MTTPREAGRRGSLRQGSFIATQLREFVAGFAWFARERAPGESS